MSFAKATDLLILARLASGRRGISLEEIESEFGCVRRTAQRMTDALIRVFPDTEDYLDSDGKKRWCIPVRSKVAEFFSPQAEQIAALEFAATNLDNQGLSSEALQLRALRQTIKILTPDKKHYRLEVDEEVLLEAMGHAARPGPRPLSNPEIDGAIAEALKGPCVLKILYRSRNETTASWRLVEPHGLLLGGRRYLVARDRNKADGYLRHYRVEDIEDACTTTNWFELDDDFSLKKHANRAFGVFQDDREFGDVVWKFAPYAAAHAARFQFHPEQESHTLDDGSLIVSFRACGHLEMCWHLYAWGDNVEVLAPKALVDLVADHRRNDFPGLP
jgi:predicted DNA-binding transcriptional regulator YafY